MEGNRGKPRFGGRGRGKRIFQILMTGLKWWFLSSRLPALPNSMEFRFSLQLQKGGFTVILTVIFKGLVFFHFYFYGPTIRSEPFILFKLPKMTRRSNISCWFIMDFELFAKKSKTNKRQFVDFCSRICTIWILIPLQKAKNGWRIKLGSLIHHGTWEIWEKPRTVDLS